MPQSRSVAWSHIALDHLLCLVVIGPLVPSFWRGTWFIYGHYVFPSNPVLHGWSLTVVGNMAAFPLYLLQNKLLQWFGNPHPITWLIAYHIFLYLFTLISIAQWKGVWILWDHYTGLNLPSAFTALAIGISIMVMLKCCKSLGHTAPLAVLHDTTRDALLTPTRFERHKVCICK